MKKSFFTGIAILLPMILTIIIVMFMINFLTHPFEEFVMDTLSYYGLAKKGLFFLTSKQTLYVLSKALILITIFGIIVFVGFLMQWFVMHYLVRWTDKLMHKIPLVNKIYKAAQDVVKSIFGSDNPQFSQVVMVPFPNTHSMSIGFITDEKSAGAHKGLFSVFVPATPNPLMGFLMLYPVDDIVKLDMKVEEALKVVISCGVVMDPIRKKKG